MAVIFSDAGFSDLFTKLFVGEAWRGGVVGGSIVATLDDYMGDLERMLEGEFYKRCGWVG